MYVEELTIPHTEFFVPCENSIVSRTSVLIRMYVIWVIIWVQGPQMPNKAISRIAHHMSPFQ